MKKFLIVLLLVLFPTLAFSQERMARISTMVIGSGAEDEVASCASCNSGNDSLFVDHTVTTTTGGTATTYLALSFTTAGTKCVTGGFFNAGDSGSTTDPHGGTFEIWTNNAGVPGSRVGDGYTSYLSDLPTDRANVDFMFAATQTLSAGTYWLVYKRDANSHYGYKNTGTGWKLSANGSSWSDVGNYDFGAGVYGCDPS